jgi:hypothetical protein
MSERFKVLVLKTNVTYVTIGSNPIFLKCIHFLKLFKRTVFRMGY